MKRTGPKTSEESKKIIRLLKRGVSPYEIIKKGFPRMTVQYYDWKLNRPEKYKAFVDKVKVHNKRRLETLAK